MQTKSAAPRRAFQAPRRHFKQPAPVYADPPGKTAADDLARALTSWTTMLGRAPRDPRAKP